MALKHNGILSKKLLNPRDNFLILQRNSVWLASHLPLCGGYKMLQHQYIFFSCHQVHFLLTRDFKQLQYWKRRREIYERLISLTPSSQRLPTRSLDGELTRTQQNQLETHLAWKKRCLSRFIKFIDLILIRLQWPLLSQEMKLTHFLEKKMKSTFLYCLEYFFLVLLPA